MINKQNLWFVTLFSLILVLGIYYVTMKDESLTVLSGVNDVSDVVEVKESDVIVALQVEQDESVLKEMNEYQNILLDDKATIEEKNDAYNALQSLNNSKSECEKIKKLIEEKNNSIFEKVDIKDKIDFDSKSSLVQLTENLKKIFLSKGLIVELSTIRSLISAIVSTKIIILDSKVKELFPIFFDSLKEFLGFESHAITASDDWSSSFNLCWNKNDENNYVITDFITEDLTVSILISVHDFSDTSYHARGKQQLKRGGMFYTAQSGIWQTVWMEIVPNEYIRDVRVTPDWDNGLVRMRIRVSSASSNENASPAHISPMAADQTDSQGTVLAFSPDRQNSSNVICKVYPPVFLEADGLNDTLCQDEITTAAIRPGKGATLSIPENMQKSWTPKEPWLYPYSLEYGKDRILGYFALRKCDVQIADDGYPRFFLNNQPYFQSGVLDQGYWPDGLYTAPSDEALIYDIRAMKDLGFNMLRKHGKIETDRWYFHCDRMGMLVWQDMPNGGSSYHHWFVTYLATLLNWMRIPVKDLHARLLSRTDVFGRQEYIDNIRDMVRTLYNHPSIVTWVPFNEGWGQFSTKKITDFIQTQT